MDDEEFVNLVTGLERASVDFRYRYRLAANHQMVARLPDDVYDNLVRRGAVEWLLRTRNIQAVPYRDYKLEENT